MNHTGNTPARPMIEIIDLHKSFGQHRVLQGIDLVCPEGTITVVLGGSGTGKSVLFKHIIGLLKPDRGRVIVDGEEISAMGDRDLVRVRHKFGMVFQNAALFDSMTVFENIAFPMQEHTKAKPKEIRRRVAELLELVSLPGYESKYPSQLSGGQRKRVGLARAVILNPKIVLWDEPTTGLDPITTDQVDEMILSATRTFQVTSVVISHDIASCMRIATQIAVLFEGKVVELSDPAHIRGSAHPFVRAFMASWFAKN